MWNLETNKIKNEQKKYGQQKQKKTNKQKIVKPGHQKDMKIKILMTYSFFPSDIKTQHLQLKKRNTK